MKSYPNQRKVTIHKPKYDGNFLQVSKAEWMAAYQHLNQGEFGLYLYLCGNQDNYEFYLSSAAVQQALQVSDSTYRRAVKSLKELGYLVEGKSERDLHFYPTPHRMMPVTDEREKAAAPVIFDQAATNPSATQYAVVPSHTFSGHIKYGWDD